MEEAKPETVEEIKPETSGAPEPEAAEAPKPETAEEPKPQQVAEAPKRDDNTVFIGKKGTMGYVLAVVTQFNNGAREVVVKARGKLISRAVDVVEIVRHRFLPDAKIDDIAIATEELTSEDGSKSKVSSIEIKIVK
ncbi:DNA-binding protein Alba [Candidatus Micrarchaeota archaeon]|nr:DNA-binding protein Alba [Candidatus Micrarchaeota archaeon]